MLADTVGLKMRGDYSVCRSLNFLLAAQLSPHRPILPLSLFFNAAQRAAAAAGVYGSPTELHRHHRLAACKPCFTGIASP